MANTTNIKIIVEGNFNLDYVSPEDLAIKFNRTVEDFTDLSKRFGEYSYTFTLPKTKNNALAFEFPDAKGRRGVFVGTQKSCRVYNNDRLLLDGVIELRAIKADAYACAFFSKFTQLLDSFLDEQGEEKTLQDILSLGTIKSFAYEPDIEDHLNAGLTPEETNYQFPLIHYSTYWTPYSITNGAAPDFNGNSFLIPDNYLQNWYYLLSSDDGTGTNQLYFHQFPLAVYIVPILEGILEDAGWSLGGSFFQRDDIQKIIMLFTGDNDIYDTAIGCPEEGISLDACTGTTGGTNTSDDLWIATFLPDIDQSEFISGLLNMFNLYFTIDVDQKIIKFETWDVLFSDKYDPYDITDKVFRDSLTFSRIDNYDPTIEFEDAENMRVLGDNKVMVSDEDIANDVTYADTEEKYTKQVFNKIGSTDSISVPFAIPNVGRKYLRNDFDVNGVDRNGGDFQIFLPILTSQTPQDNDSKPFYKTTGDTFVQNDEGTIKYKGKPTLMWYYGQSESDYEKVTGHDNANFYWCRIGTTDRTKIGFANPFTLVQGAALDRVNEYLATPPIAKSKDTAEASYLKGLHYNIGKVAGDVADVPPFSLTFGESDEFHNTLYTEFHKNKYDLYYNSELLEGTMRMDEFSWNEMQINRPIRYNDEIYSIISIDNYDVVNNTATIKLIKK